METIRNPIEWGADWLRGVALHLTSVGRAARGNEANTDLTLPVVRRIETADLKTALTKGLADFAACRTDVIFICLMYPIIGLAFVWLATDSNLLPLIFPAASGFALLGPIAAVGLYEMSRRREMGDSPGWNDAFGIVRSPSFGVIVILGLVLLAIFCLWLAVAQLIYMATLGPQPPASVASFLRDVFTTGEGWAMILVGMSVGFIFAVVVLAISVVSFPLLLDRDVGLATAVATSIQVVADNPVQMALWGLIVAGGLVVGSLPLFLGLIFVLPILGHATWHLYRTTVSH